MKSTIAATILFTSLALAQTNAPIINNNPSMATYQAILQMDKPIQGSLTGVSTGNGTGVTVSTNFFNFPSDGAPFIYHVHQLPVPDNGSCDATGAHLDPYNRGETPACDATQPQTCQLGDLSGKHGAIMTGPDATSFQKLYTDLYLSTTPGDAAYIGNRSVVIHASNGTRLNCGNFVGQGSTANASSTTASSSSSSSASSTAAASPSSTKNAAAAAAVGQTFFNTGALVAAVAVLVL